MRQPRSSRGFTLIELLLVVAVIGLIASVMLIGQHNTTIARRDVKRYSDIKALQQALALYTAKAQSYPVYDGCLDGADPVNAGLHAESIVPADTVFSDPSNPSNPASCYYYAGNVTSYNLRYTIERDSSVGPAGEYTITP